jgi:hypothetical protein
VVLGMGGYVEILVGGGDGVWDGALGFRWDWTVMVYLSVLRMQ